nr:hypothetical protein [Solimonas sp. K1W22B-7]
MEEHYTRNVQPSLDFCRSCHVPGGIGDVDTGRKFQLSSNRAEDLANLKASWERLGGNNPTSRILLMASGQETPHSGGAPWPKDSAAYRNMSILLQCFADPAGCVGLLGGAGTVSQLPLLGSKRARHLWQTYCEGDGTAASPAQADSAVLPPDPRTLIVPGVNQNKAVYYNAWYEDCHVASPEAEQSPKTCGEYRARRGRGLKFLQDDLAIAQTTAAEFNDTWKKWGLTERPANFDQMYTLRYGLNHAPFNNPYPLPGEDPKTTAGGSGQLPLGLRQIKDADGNWTGQIGSTDCHTCHGGQIGDPASGEPEIVGLSSLGLGNANFDSPMIAKDQAPLAAVLAGSPLSALPPINPDALVSANSLGIEQRGQNNAVGTFELLLTVLDYDSLGLNPNFTKLYTAGGLGSVQDVDHPISHTQDTPAWWNWGSRPRKFYDAGLSNDSQRILMAAGAGDGGVVLTLDGKPYRERIEHYDQDVASYLLSLQSPAYPESIDTALAEQGAILFHAKNLWAESLHNPVPKPVGGNGSCAGCHGAYSPRYVNDPAYLESPVLEGVAGHISTLDVIGTDRARVDFAAPVLRRVWDSTWFAYPESSPGYVRPEDKSPVTEKIDDNLPLALRPKGVCGWEKEVIGYQAPPLYGTWATAPYFHNGSVPTIEQVLDSSKRSPIWRRKLQTEGPVTGFDQRLATAYDFDALGWKHDLLSCSDIPGNMLENCNPLDEEGPSVVQIVTNLLAGLGWPGVLVLPQTAPHKRFVYDTRSLGNANTGHQFADVLTDQERKAIIEYLKTL